MSISISKLVVRFAPVIALVVLVVAMDGTWATAQPGPAVPASPASPPGRPVPARGAPAPSPASAPAASSATRAAPPRTTTTAATTTVATATADPSAARPAPRPGRKEVTGKLNLNTATEAQLMLLPTVGPAKAERIIAWRKKSGGFRRVADLRRVKGFGYKTLKRLEPFLDIQGETTLTAKR
jgi:competence protein ComEA